MGFLDRLLGRDKDQPNRPAWGSPGGQPGYQQDGYQQGGYQQGGYPPQQLGRPGAERGSDQQSDQAAIARYRYMLKTAPPERIEEAHAEAFAKLSPDQRAMVLSELSQEVPAAERARSDDPRELARMATRAEMRNPGTLERSFSRPSMGGGFGGGGIGMGGMIAGGLLAGVAGAFVGTAIADAMFDDNDFQEGYEAGQEDQENQDQDQDSGQDQAAADPNQDAPDDEVDAAGDFGDFGGGDDFGDFGGGDY